MEDEARLGLKPVVRRVWVRRGKHHRPVCSGAAAAYQWLCFFGFVRPKTGATEWFTVPGVSTQAMDAVDWVRPRGGCEQRNRVLLVLDQAGWHVDKDLMLPTGIHLFHSPELSPAEHLWPPVREELANHFFSHLDDLGKSLAARCRQLTQVPLSSKAPPASTGGPSDGELPSQKWYKSVRSTAWP